MRKSFLRSFLAVAGLLAMTLGLLASGATSAAAKTSQVPRAKVAPSIFWLEQGAGNPYWNAEHLAAAQACKKLGCTFKVFSGNLSATDEAAILKQLAAEHPSMIMVNPIDPSSIVPSILYTEKQGVPVLCLYSICPQATGSILFNETRSGQLDAQYAITLLKKRYGSVKGTIAVLGGVEGQPTSDIRLHGFTDYIAKNAPGVKVVAFQPTDWNASNATTAMEDWLTKFPNLSMVYGESDTLSVPATVVAARANRLCTRSDDWTKNPSCIIFVSVDGFFLNDAVNGTLFSTEMYSPQWSGYVFDELGVRIALHESFPKVTLLKSLFVDNENAACLYKMQTDMAAHVATFDFTAAPTQQGLAAKFGCKVLDANE